MTDQQYEIARRRVDQLRGLGAHVFVFVAVNAAIFTQTGFQPEVGRFWGWGIGVVAHALVVLSPGTRFKQRMIEQQVQQQIPVGNTHDGSRPQGSSAGYQVRDFC